MFAKRLAELRKKKGLTQYELADLLNLTRGQVGNYEQGKRQPDFDILQLFADFFNVTTDYLLGHTDDPRPGCRTKTPPDIRQFARAGEKMTPEQRERLLKVAEVLFPEAFKEE
jgi:transcriptional regulator with XRE-family HTH domain